MPGTLTPLVLSALVGAAAALVVTALYKIVGKLLAEWKPLAEYKCADRPPARPAILVGLLLHGRGKAINDDDATYGQAWEHTPGPAEEDRLHTIFGPYVNDFRRPGFYKVRFRLCGKGFSSAGKTPVIVLDIIQRPVFLKDDNLVLSGQRVIRANELSDKYKWFDVYCYVTGGGNYEYRCLVIPDSFIPDQHCLRFDVIRVHAHIPAQESFLSTR